MYSSTRGLYVRMRPHTETLIQTSCSSSRKYNNDPDDYYIPLKHAKPYNEMPAVPMIPFFGSAWAYFPIIGKYSTAQLHKADLLKHKKYGDIVRERFGNFEVVSCYAPEGMHVIKEHGGIYPARSEFATLKTYRRKRKAWYPHAGLLMEQGTEWQKLRNNVEDYFQKDGYGWYLPQIQEISKDFVGLMRTTRDVKSEVHDATDSLYKWALECVSLVALDTRFNCLNPHLEAESDGMKLIDSIHTQLRYINRMEASLGNFPFWKYYPTPMWQQFTYAADAFTAIAFKHIVNSVDKHCSNPEQARTGTLMHKLLVTENMDISSAMVIAADVMLGGIDTTANTAAFLLYHLAKNPDKQEKLYEEIQKLLPHKETVLTNDLYAEFKYPKYCLKESMRLLPTVRGNLRVFDHDVALKGYRIPAGTAVLCVLQVIQKDEKYFKDANKFVPERWELGKEPKSMYTYQPFGYGRRNCIGKRLAEREIITLVIEMIRNFKIEYHYADMDMYTRLINTPNKLLRLRLHER